MKTYGTQTVGWGAVPPFSWVWNIPPLRRWEQRRLDEAHARAEEILAFMYDTPESDGE